MSTSVRGIRFKNSSPAVPVLVPLWNSVAESIPFDTDGTFTCGSSPESDVQISLRGVRADHCRLNLTNGALTITSGDGPVWINDLPVTRNAPVTDGDVLSVGPASFRVEWIALPTATPARQSVSRAQMDPHGREIDGIAAGKRETHDPVNHSGSPSANQSVWHPFSTAQGADSSVRKSEGPVSFETWTASCTAASPIPVPQSTAEMPAGRPVQNTHSGEKSKTVEKSEPVDEKARKLNRKLQSDVITLRQENSLLAARIEELQPLKEQLKATALELQQLKIQHSIELETREIELTLLRDERASGEHQLRAEFAAESEQFSRAADEARIQLEQTREQLEQTREQLEQSRDQLEQTRDQLEQTRDQLEQTRDQLEQTREQLEQTREQLEQTREQLAERDDKLAAFETQVGELQQMRGELADRVQAAEVFQQELNSRAQSMQQRDEHDAQTAERLTAWEARLKTLESEIAERNNELSLREARIHEASEQIAALREQHDGQLADLQRRLDGMELREILLNEREEGISSRETALTTAETSVSTRLAALESEESAFQERRILQESKTAELQDTLALIAHRTAALDISELRVREYEERLQMLEDREIGFSRRESHLESVEARLREQQESLDQLHRDLARRESAVRQDLISLAELKETLDHQIPDLSQQERLLQTDFDSLKSLEKQISEIQRENQNRCEELNLREKGIRDEEDALKLRIEQAIALESSVTSRQNALHDALQSQQSTLEFLNQKESELNEKSADIHQRSEGIQRQLEELTQLRSQLEDQTAEAQQLTADLKVRLEEHEHLRSALEHQQNQEIADLRSQLESQCLRADELSIVIAKLESEREQIVAAQLHAKNTELADLHEQLESQRLRADELSSAIARLESEREQNAAEMQLAQNRQIADLQSQLESQCLRADELSSVMAKLESEREHIVAAQMHAKNTELADLHEQLEAQRLRVDELSNVIDRLESEREQNVAARQHAQNTELADLHEQLEAQRAAAIELRDALIRSTELAEQQRAECMRLNEELIRVASTSVSVDAMRPDSGESESLRSDLAAAKAELQKMSSERENLITALREMQASMQQISQEIEQGEHVRGEQQRSLESMESRLRSQSDEIDQRNGRIEELELQLKSMVSEISSSMRTDGYQTTTLISGNENSDYSDATRSVSSDSSGEWQPPSLLSQLWKTGNDSDPSGTPTESHSERPVIGDDYSSYTPTPFRSSLSANSFSSSTDNGTPMHSEFDENSRPMVLTEAQPEDGSLSSSASSSASEEEVTQLRSELASLFGLKSLKAPVEAPVDTYVDTSVPAPDDERAGVELKFTSNPSLLLQVPAANQPDSASSSTEESPDFVTDYMEQLLARSRKVAGGALPNELQKSQSGQQSKPKTTSFIEQYMATHGSEVGGSDNASDAGLLRKDPSAQRPKIDRDKLRENMVSFRSVSAMSVENALATAAMKKERHFIIGRIAFVFLLVVLSVAQVIATFTGIYNEPMVLWASIIATIVVGLELTRKLTGIRGRIRSVLAGNSRQNDQAEAAITDGDKEAESLTEAPEKNKAASASTTSPVAQTASTGAVSTHSRMATGTEPVSENDDDRYFEL